jgi:hypothetical protein
MTISKYISADEVIFNVLANVADQGYKSYPKGFYIGLIQRAVEELALDTKFEELRMDFDFPMETLTLALPDNCFDVKNVYIFNGDVCNIDKSHKVWWKKNYFPKGNGYIANDKGHNEGDPFYGNHSLGSNRRENHIHNRKDIGVERRLFYNIQMGNIMFSSSCRGRGNKVHIHYNGTGSGIGENPLIPVQLRTVVEDYVTEATLRAKIASDADPRRWQALYNVYASKLDKEGMNGSWYRASMRVKQLNESQREELKEYLARGAWSRGL